MTLVAELASLAEALAAEGGRLAKRALIATAIGKVASQPTVDDAASDLAWLVLYLAGQPFAEADARKLNAGGALLSRVLKTVSGASDAALMAAYRRHGDLGAAAYDVLTPPLGRARAEATLTLADVAEAFDAMARARSTQARSAAVEQMLGRAPALEAKYLLKLMLGDMRIGVKQSLIEEAIAVAATTAGRETVVEAVRHAVMLEADLGGAAVRAFAGTLADARLRLFHPLGFMLASPVETPEDAVARFAEKPAKAVKPAKSKRVVKRKRAEVSAQEASGRDALAAMDTIACDAAEEGLAEDIAALAGDAGAQGDSARPWSEEHAVATVENQAEAPIHAFLEDKFDGMRAQIHWNDGEQPGRVAIYSRNREDITESFPEIVEAFAKAASIAAQTGPLILDGEILGWDFAVGKALPFAVLGQRIGRKRVDSAMRSAVPVVFMAFDLLARDGELTLAWPLRQRRAALESLAEMLAPLATAACEQDESVAPGGLFAPLELGPQQPRLLLSPAKLVESAAAIDQAYTDARARANEGVMLKAAGSVYLPGRRGLAWLKLKRQLATLDVVITGAEFGHGRRAQMLSDYTFAVRGPRGAHGEPPVLLNVGKAYSGVTDAEIAELTAWLKEHTLEDYGHFRSVEPLRVLEVAFNNIMRSERHASGFALRFPRIIRVRDDKPVAEIDTLERVEEIFREQPDRAGE